jgi:hypothetical protein
VRLSCTFFFLNLLSQFSSLNVLTYYLNFAIVANRNLIFAIHGGLGTFEHAIFDVEHFKEGGQFLKRELFYVE